MMRNFYTFAAAAMVFIPVMARNTVSEPAARHFSLENMSRFSNTELIHGGLAASRPVAIAEAAPPANEIITEAPEGEKKIYARSNMGYSMQYGQMRLTAVQGAMQEVVECEDGTVYIYSPVSMLATSTYIKGERVGDEIIVKLPQTFYKEEYEGETHYFNIDRLDYDEYDEFYYLINWDESRNIRFKIEDGRWVMQESDDGVMIMGITDTNGAWYGFGDYECVFTPFNGTAVTLPEGVEPVEWVMTYGGDGHKVNVAMDGDDVYVQGVSRDMPQACIKGSLEADGKLRFPSDQFLGNGEAGFMYFMAATGENIYNEAAQQYQLDLTKADALDFVFDRENSVMKSEDYAVINVGSEDINYLQYLEAPMLYLHAGEVSLMPAAPSLTDYMPYTEMMGYGGFRFEIPKLNEDGKLLDSGNMYYRVYFDTELLELTPDEYGMLKEPMTDIPYDFTDDYDIEVDGTRHEFFFYRNNLKRVGIQSVYKNDKDGKEYATEVVTYNLDGSDSLEMTDVDKDAVEVVYTDLSGRTTVNPERGIYIKTVRYSDGSVKNFKVAVK